MFSYIQLLGLWRYFTGTTFYFDSILVSRYFNTTLYYYDYILIRDTILLRRYFAFRIYEPGEKSIVQQD